MGATQAINNSVEVDVYGVEYIDAKGRVQYPDDHRNGMTSITHKLLCRFQNMQDLFMINMILSWFC